MNLKFIKNTSFVCMIASAITLHAQPEKDSTLSVYRATATKLNALVHTKLDVRFDYAKRYLYGKEWVTLKPYAYATDSLTLDAKGMDLKTISLVNGSSLKPLKYAYNGDQIKIKLDRTYAPAESYTVFLDYTAKPNELKVKGSSAINDAKGLYFINPDSAIAGKPVQIWTQGESESSSAWFPTIDKPNQKTTSEINITYPAKYVSLSNGKLVKQVKNANGTRTDTWKMDLPHSPYLFMMAVGNFKIYHDKWKDKEVSYYLEPAFAPYAKQIFGLTPEMIGFFSKKLGVDYPWNKYSQVVVRDYVSGAMENTTATLHGDFVQQTPRELADQYYGTGESVIAHELFHQWFGDYVTTESWSNLTVNESFADFSETIWAEYKYGKDAADAYNHRSMLAYLRTPGNDTKDLVRFHYDDKEDVFDAVTYQKGGRILMMLRNYLGDAVFFKGLNIYLKQNALNNGEAQQLRLALEQASGKDLNWFFNQWYYYHGHPKLTIDYNWDDASKKQQVTIKQTQNGTPFIIPMAIDVYSGGKMSRHLVTVTDSAQTFTFSASAKPDLVNVDGDKLLLCEKIDHKSLGDFAYQYAHAPLYMDRLEAIQAATKKLSAAESKTILQSALKDKFYGLRVEAIKSLKDSKDPAVLASIRTIASGDPNYLVQAEALNAITPLKDESDLPLIRKALTSQSYTVQGSALMALAYQKPDEALQAAKGLEKNSKKSLTEAVTTVYAKYGSEEQLPFIAEKFESAGPQAKINMTPAFINMLGKSSDQPIIKKGIDQLKDLGIKYKSYGIDKFAVTFLNQLKQQKGSDKAIGDYVDAAIAEINK
ncbi:DUF3458 domain-containing protein [Pedobacter sp. HMF7647]|uniref:Aminopeptidase N n=1 Tax=Hufsiella arboris TaxID=2695275 RepID=A0A7K1Y916_9SPHI|nr:M1 family aminopeptidase [Hufsiella arboris]MXV51093.1 DUF3458 domain-containing protein [Hufsiella arboris]